MVLAMENKTLPRAFMKSVRALFIVCIALVVAFASTFPAPGLAFATQVSEDSFVSESLNPEDNAVAPVAHDAVPAGITHGNLVLVVRFAGDTSGDGQTGYNAPYSAAGSSATTQWERLIEKYNSVASGATWVSFRAYIKTISQGQHEVYSTFPQTREDGGVDYITLPGAATEYVNNDQRLLSEVAAQFAQQFPDYDASSASLIRKDYLDNVVIIPQVGEGIFTSHKADGSSYNLLLGNKYIGSYNIVDTTRMNSGGEPDPASVAAHEYLHSYGAPDLYRLSGSGEPVGIWDVMAKGASRSWPLAQTRQDIGWTTLKEVTAAGTYTLGLVGSEHEQAIMVKSPRNDTEYFVIEYRKKGAGSADLDRFIGGTGLIVYRVNPLRRDMGNTAGDGFMQDYIYLFRPGETGLTDAAGNPYYAYLTNTANRPAGVASSLGSTDLSATITDGALVYSDGTNSGIRIDVVGEGSASSTFKLSFADYSQQDYWLSTLGGENASIGSNLNNSQLVVAGSTLYLLTEENMRTYHLYRINTATAAGAGSFVDLGVIASREARGQLVVVGQTLYFVSLSSGFDKVQIRRYDGSSWTLVTSHSAGIADVACASISGELYVALHEDVSRRLIVFKLSGSNLVQVGNALNLEKSSFSDSSVIAGLHLFDLGGKAAVTFSDFSAASPSTSVFSLNSGVWKLRRQQAGTARIQSSARIGDVTYLYRFIDGALDPQILRFKGEAFMDSTSVSALPRTQWAANLTAAQGRLYVSLIEDNNAMGVARVYACDPSAITAWSQVGFDVCTSASSSSAVSAVSHAGQFVVALVDGVKNAAVLKQHELLAVPQGGGSTGGNTGGSSGDTSGGTTTKPGGNEGGTTTKPGDSSKPGGTTKPGGSTGGSSKPGNTTSKPGGNTGSSSPSKPSTIRPTAKNGWVTTGLVKKYYVSGKAVTGWHKINNAWYYFSTSGAMTTGWQKIGGVWYYLMPKTGVMQTGWLKVGGTWYYLKSSGAMATGWLKVGGIWYYLKANGAMATGWNKVGGAWYYLRANGAMATGWLKTGGVWYYLTSSGAMATNWAKVGGVWYYLTPGSGAMKTGWYQVGGWWYYSNSSGAMQSGWVKTGGSWYYLDGSGRWV